MARFVRSCVVVTVVVLVATTTAAAKGGYGVVTVYRVGRLIMDTSTDADVRAFAGQPDSVTHYDPDSSHSYKYYTYRFPHGKYVQYTFTDFQEGWFLEGFDTNLRRFETDHGTRVGMTVREAERRERLRYSPGCFSGLRRDRQGFKFELVLLTNSPPSRIVGLHTSGPYPDPC